MCFLTHGLLSLGKHIVIIVLCHLFPGQCTLHIIKQQLQLRPGESLSINTESSTIEFARLLARMAAETTREPVHIVETKHGKVLQVYPIDPQLNDALRPPVSGLAMCHIVDLDSAPYYSEESPQDLAKDVVQLGRFGILADPPELERRLAAPWANVPYPGPDWGLQYLGNEATEGDMWKLFMSLFRLDAHDPAEYWSNQAGMMNLRKRILNQHLADTITLRDQDWELMVRIAMDTQWTGGETVLSNGRKFLSQLPLQHVYASVDTQSANGSFLSSRPFLLLGKLVRNARFVVEGGEVTEQQPFQRFPPIVQQVGHLPYRLRRLPDRHACQTVHPERAG